MNRGERGQRGSVLVIVLVMMLMFVAAGGAAVIISQSALSRAKNREWTMQATAAAEAGLHWAVTQMMVTPAATTNLNSAAFSDVTLDVNYAPTFDGIIETVVQNKEYRIYTRGKAGTNWGLGAANGPIKKYLRAYVIITNRGLTGTVRLRDWQEVPESVVHAHFLTMVETDPYYASFHAWFPNG